MSEQQQPKRPKFKWTKELVNIALNDGMTQEQIGRLCRVEQSVVSGWKNGKYKATEKQLGELLRRYGARLNRKAARVYLVCDEPIGKWQDTETGSRLVALHKRHVALNAEVEAHRKAAAARRKAEFEAEQARRREKGADIQDIPGFYGETDQHQLTPEQQAAWEQILAAVKELGMIVAPYNEGSPGLGHLIELFRADFEAKGPQRIVQVEGTILFRYTFCRLVGRAYRRGLDMVREPICRWIVHDLGRGKVQLVVQERRRLTGTAKERWKAEVDSAKRAVKEIAQHSSNAIVSPFVPSDMVDCVDDAARWCSSLNGPMTVEELLKATDVYLADPKTLHNPHDEQVVPYLLRKALIEHGHPVAGIERITGLE